jgi:hypothetical protein
MTQKPKALALKQVYSFHFTHLGSLLGTLSDPLPTNLFSFINNTSDLTKMPKLSAWLKKHLRPSPKKHPKDALPMLPSPRRPITPESFTTAACLLFQLPWDIRCMIFSIALGGNTLHMDLARQDGTWKWGGLVCSQDGDVSQLPSPRHPWSTPRVWNDGCLQFQQQRRLPESNVGIMGFLLSCRQAYTEGIGFLYSANSIFIQSETLLLNLPGLIPANRLTRSFIDKLSYFTLNWATKFEAMTTLNWECITMTCSYLELDTPEFRYIVR